MMVFDKFLIIRNPTDNPKNFRIDPFGSWFLSDPKSDPIGSEFAVSDPGLSVGSDTDRIRQH